MPGYTPLFPEIVNSSIWNEDAKTCKVWVTFMALADVHGNVYGSASGLASICRMSISECKTAINILMAVDPDSRSSDEEGRRLVPIEGGWHLVNHKKYRDKAKSRAEYLRNWRAQKKKAPQTPKEETNQYSYSYSNKDTQRNSMKHNDTHETCFTIQQVKDACIPNGIPENNAQSYYDHYNSQGWKKANGQQITNLQSHMAKRWNKAKLCWDFDEKKKNEQNTNNRKSAERDGQYIR